MQTLKSLFTKLFLLLFLSLSSSLYGASYSCNGEDVASLNGATGDAYVSYNTDYAIGKNGARYFKFKTLIGGEISIKRYVTNWGGGYKNHELDIGTSCDGTEIYDGENNKNQQTDTTTFTVVANTTYYVKVQEANTKNYLNFDIFFDFVADIVIGCNDSLDTSTNYSNPGPTIPLLDGATDDVTTCISGTLDNGSATEYYHFTVQTAGTLTMTTSSPDNSSYNMGVAGYIISDKYWMPNSYYAYSDTSPSPSHAIPSIYLNAGDSVYIVFQSNIP